MYKTLIKNYVDNLKKENIIKFIGNNNYQVDDKEIDIIYFYIKNYWEDIYDNKDEVWSRLKNDVSESTYKKIVNLFNDYSKYIK